jgi:hypothetical protein
MSSAVMVSAKRTRLVVWLFVTAGLLLVVVANWHLVYVAFTSQPECVAHVRTGVANSGHGSFSAAQSSCSP